MRSRGSCGEERCEPWHAYSWAGRAAVNSGCRSPQCRGSAPAAPSLPAPPSPGNPEGSSRNSLGLASLDTGVSARLRWKYRRASTRLQQSVHPLFYFPPPED